jgi:hydrophobe/amphiphile efflux-3 (HAE3) family protein
MPKTIARRFAAADAVSAAGSASATHARSPSAADAPLRKVTVAARYRPCGRATDPAPLGQSVRNLPAVRERFARIAGWCVENPVPVVVGVLLLAVIGAVAALRLEPDAGTDQLVDDDSAAFRATEDFRERFGDDAVVVLVKGDLEQLVLTSDLGTLLSLEGCLSGNVDGGKVFTDAPAPEPCAEIAEEQPAQAVLGGATFLNQSAIQAERLLREQSEAVVEQARAAAAAAAEEARAQGLSDPEVEQAAAAAAQEILVAFEAQIQQLAIEYGQTGLPALDDPTYVSSVVFDPTTQGQPKPRFSIFWPSTDAAQILIRLKPGLSEAERSEAIDLIRAAVADDAFRIRDATYVVSGAPVVVEGLADELSSSIVLLLVAALVVMTLTLALIFGPPARLLPLAIALVAAALTFGLLALFGGSLTMASIAVLPILIGLAVDYAIQFQARFNEARDEGSSPARAAVEAAARGGPVIATAAVATASGFLVLLLSPIPMVRGFALMLVAGILLAFAVALTAGLAALSLTRRDHVPRGPRIPGGGRLAAVSRAKAAVGARITAIGKRALAFSVAAPGRVLAVGLAVAILGFAVGTRTEVISDLRELVPADLPELRNVDELQDATGVSGEVEVAVQADDLTDPAVVAWMADFRARVLDRAGFGDTATPCVDQDASLCPFVAMPDLFGSDPPGTADQVEGILNLLPEYFLAAFVSRDGPTAGTAVIPFGIKVMPFDEQKALIDSIRAEIDPPGTENDPPEGVSAEVVGLPVLAADANAALESNRYLLTLAGLAAVALALLAIYRSLRRALVPLAPIVLATGWSSLGLAITGVPLNPMSATLGALVIAIATEFSVLLASRYEEERTPGVGAGEALRRAYSRTGMAVVASGITAIAGFAVLIATDIRMLRDFGIVTVIDLSVALLGVLLVLPAALIWAEGRATQLPRVLRFASAPAGSRPEQGRQVEGG